ncbi:divalent cation transporter [Marinobacteraceae bacterium S3BR75-40.1]
MDWFRLLGLSILAGAAIPIGAAIGRFRWIHREWLEQEMRHGVIAFGGGVLLAAVALVLVPEGSKSLSILDTVLWMLSGGIFFCAIDILLARSQTSASQLVAMLADFLPEAMALGALLASDGNSALLLALLIALQNLPEGFNAYRELVAQNDPRHVHRGRVAQGLSPNRVLFMFLLLVLVGPAAALFGHLVLSEMPWTLGGLMLFASGGILYLTFQDLAPQSRLERHWAPPLGAVCGFLLGLVGHLMLKG